MMRLLQKCGMTLEAAAVGRGDLTELRLGFHALGNDEADIIARFLKENNTVTKVLLWRNAIGPRGAKAIADALKDNRTVKVVDFFKNHIGEQGAEALIEALHHNVCLTCVYLGNSGVFPKFKAAIEYFTETRNAKLVPAAVRRAVLCFLLLHRKAPGGSCLALVPRDLVSLIARLVWASRSDPQWIKAVQMQ